MSNSSTHQNVLAVALAANLPVIAWGQPGVGKTSVVRQEASRRGWPMLEVIASRRAPEDFGGWPTPTADGLRFEPGAGFRDFAALAVEANGGILFLDELSCAPPAVQAALLSLILDRKIGDWQLPACVRVVAAANPADTAAGGWDLAAPAANRLLHVDFPTPSVEAWTEWLLGGSVRPGDGDTWSGEAGARARGLAAGYLQRVPSSLFSLPADEAARGRAWASPRSWEAACRGLAACEGFGDEVVEAVVIGALGEGVGREFASYAREANLPRPEAVLADPGCWAPDRHRADRTLVVLAGAVAAVLTRPTEERFKAGWAVLGRAAEAGQSGVAAVAARSLAAVGRIRFPKVKVPDAFAGLLK